MPELAFLKVRSPVPDRANRLLVRAAGVLSFFHLCLSCFSLNAIRCATSSCLTLSMSRRVPTWHPWSIRFFRFRPGPRRGLSNTRTARIRSKSSRARLVCRRCSIKTCSSIASRNLSPCKMRGATLAPADGDACARIRAAHQSILTGDRTPLRDRPAMGQIRAREPVYRLGKRQRSGAQRGRPVPELGRKLYEGKTSALTLVK